MHIRQFQDSDFETLYEIDQACFPPGISYSRKELRGFIRRCGARTWVAEENRRIVGFVVQSSIPQRIGHIVTIDVVKDARRSGIGKALMRVCEDSARAESLRLIRLETAENNLAALAFYNHLGYTKVGEIPGYYCDGTTALVMVKRLAGS